MKTKLNMLVVIIALLGLMSSCVPVTGTPREQAQAVRQNQATAAAAGSFAGAMVEEFTGGRRDRRGYGYGHRPVYPVVPIVPIVPFFGGYGY